LDEFHFRDLFAALPSPCLVLSPDLTIVAANDAFLRETMRDREKLEGRHLAEVFPLSPPEPRQDSQQINEHPSMEALHASLMRVMETGLPETLPVIRYEIDRGEAVGVGCEEHYWRATNVPVHGADGRIAYIIHQLEDVTAGERESRAARAALRESEEFSRMIIESVTEYAIFTMDLEGAVRSWNLGAQKVLEYEEEEIVGRHASVIFTPEDRAEGAPQSEMRVALETGRAEDKRWHVRRNGERFWANGALMTLHDEGGQIHGFVKVLRDDTLQMEVENAARQRARRLEILTHAAAGLLVTQTPEEAMPALFQAMAEEFGIDAALSFVFDEETQEFHLAASAGISEGLKKKLSPLGKSICRNAALTRSTLHATEIQSSSDETFAGAQALGLRAFSCFPLIANDKLLGTLAFGTRNRDSFSDDDLAFFKTLAQYVTAVRERRRVEQALRASESRLRLAIDAGRMAVWESDVRRDFISGSPELNRLLGFSDDARPSTAEIRERYYPGDREKLVAAAEEAMARGESFAEAEFRVVWPDKSVHWLLLRAELRQDDNGAPAGAVGVTLDITARKREEERGRLLTNELNHRVKNTLATMQAVASQTFRNAKSLNDARQSFLDRLSAMAGAHDILTRESWEGAELGDVAKVAAAGFDTSGRIDISGPRVRLVPRTAIAVAMALHELATNAVKYGSLSAADGRVELTWRIDGAPGEERLRMEWREYRGPPVAPPTRRGFGSRLIEDGLSRELGGDVRILFEPGGVICTVDCPLPARSEADEQ
jgi:PAS domain S-box-containing protein